MSDRLLVSTRKGFFLIDTQGWRIDHAAFLGDICNLAFRDPRDGAIYLAQALGHFGAKLHRSKDNGRSWKEVAAPAYAKAGEGEEAPSVSHLFSLESDLGAKAGGLWCGTIPGGLFHSADGGESWQLNQGLWNHPARKEWVGGGLDHPGMGSVEVDPRDPKHMTVGVSTGGVWQTNDGGKSWRNTTKGLYAEFLPPERRHDPILQDIHRVVLCPTAPERLWLQHHNGVFRSDDAGETWHDVTAIRPAKFGFAVQVHPKDPDTAWFVPGIKDEARIPVGGKVVVSRTKDGGKSFEVFDKGLPGPHAYDIVLRHALAVDGEGRRLAMGSTTGHLWASEDGGQSWRLIAGHLPPIAAVRFG